MNQAPEPAIGADALPVVGVHEAHHVIHSVEAPHQLGPVARFDDAVDRAFDRLRGREPYDRIFYALTELGDFSLFWHLLAWARAVPDPNDLPSSVRLSAVLGIESVVVNGAFKSVFKRERPVIQVERPHRLRIPLTTSFPSGHASAAMVAAMLLSDDSNAWPIYWALAVAMAASRIYVRIHHASDVVGGLAVGLTIGTVARRVWRSPRARRH